MRIDFFEQEFSYDLFKDLSHPRVVEPMEDSLFGALFKDDFSNSHVLGDPLIHHFKEANHFLNHNMTSRKSRLTLRVKFFVKDLFGRKPKAKKPKSKKPRQK